MIDQIIVTYNIIEVVSKNNVKKINFPSQLFIGSENNIYTRGLSSLIPIPLHGASNLVSEALVSASKDYNNHKRHLH